jgi:predicted RNA-binding Zn ribbon-like protein
MTRDYGPHLVADHLALDFLNSGTGSDPLHQDWLEDGSKVLDWLVLSGAIEPAVAREFKTQGDAFGELNSIAEEARGLRQWLCSFVDRHQGGELDSNVIGELSGLNRLLARDSIHHVVEVKPASPKELEWGHARRWTAPERLLMPIAEAIGDLVCHADFRRVRTCEGAGCVLVFLDTTKANARRWCSMSLCGNRAKAAASRARKRQQANRGGKSKRPRSKG